MLQIFCHSYSPIQENTYLLYNESGSAIIIDPGCYYTQEKEHFEQVITDKKLKIEMILLTHCHLDHVYGLKWAAEKFKIIPRFHRLEVPILAQAPISGLMYNTPFDNYHGQVNYIEDNEVIMLGEDALMTLLLPGHSPGSLGFYCEKQQFIVSGDVLFQSGIGRTDLLGGNYDTLIQSIKEKMFVLSDQTKVYNGHGNPTIIGFEKRNNPLI